MSGAELRGPVELSFVYTEDEYLAAWRVYRERTQHARFNHYLVLGVLLSMLLLTALAGEPVLFGVMLFCGLFGMSLRYLTERVQTRRVIRRDPRFGYTYSLTFAEEGIHLVAKGYDARLGWDFYQRILETPDFFFLVYGDGLYLLLPKRALRDRGQESALRELLRRKLGDKVEAYGLPAAEARAVEREYVPPSEPPDWR